MTRAAHTNPTKGTNQMKDLTQADVVRLLEDAGLTMDIRGSLRVTHKTGTFLYDIEDEDDSGVYIAMHQDTIDADTARAVANEKYRVKEERRVAEEEELKAAFLKTDEGKEWVEKSAFPTIDFSGGSKTDFKATWVNCTDLSGGKPWLT
jgi:hypothetical protein